MGSDVRHVRGEAQKELVKKFEVFSSNGRSRWQVWSDWITMSAIAVSNATDQSHFDEREKQYLSIAGKYTRPEMEAFTEMLALLVVALEDNPEQDFLGELYMCLGLGNDHAGQFFTPYHLCEFMSAVTTPQKSFSRKSEIGDGLRSVIRPAALGPCWWRSQTNAERKASIIRRMCCLWRRTLTTSWA